MIRVTDQVILCSSLEKLHHVVDYDYTENPNGKEEETKKL